MTSPRRPLSPQAQAVLRARAALSRRDVLAGTSAAGLAAFLAACGTGGSGGGTASGKPVAAKDTSDTDKIVRWANWALYLDYDDKTKKFPTLEAFQAKTGIKATYAEDIEDNTSYYGKVSGQMKNGQDMGKDVIAMTDWMAGQMIREGLVQKLDKAQMPNAANILDALTQVGFDKGRQYSLTWQSGLTGFGYDAKKLKEITGKSEIRTVAELWDPKLRGKVEVLSEMRDTIGLIMLAQGAKPEDFTPEQFDKALAEFQDNIDNQQIRQVKGNSYKEDLISGDAVAVIGWSGDMFQLKAENPDRDFKFTLPESGAMLWSDNMMIPIGSPHKKNAELLMNYYYDPAVAAEVAAYVNYICPVKGAQEAMQKLDPELAKSPLIFPSQDDLAKAHVFADLNAADAGTYNDKFETAMGA